MDGKRTRGWHPTRIELAIGILLVLVACAVAYVVLAFYVGLPPRRLVRGLIGLLAYPGLFVLLVLFVDSMLRIFGGPDHGNRTRAWYQTRVLLAIGIGAVLTIGFVVWFSNDRVVLLGISLRLVLLTALLSALIGLAWMIRIFRGSGDEPRAWRYRDR